jgi:hypothetical protein
MPKRLAILGRMTVHQVGDEELVLGDTDFGETGVE